MAKESDGLPWVTPARYVGPGMLAALVVGVVVAFWFATDQRFDEAIITLLIATCFLLVGLADLLGEVIRLLARRTGPGS